MESADESSRLLEEEMDVKPPPLPPSPPQLPSSSLPQLSSPPLPPQLPSSSPPQLLPPLQLPPLPQPPPPPPELPSSPPPQPPLPAQLPLPPSPPPPPSMQTSNQNTDMLDFDSDVGGNTNHTENQDAVMDDAMTSEEGSEQKDSSEGEIHEVNECGQHKRKAPVQEPMETNHKSKCLHSDPKPDIEDEVNWVAIEQASGPPKHTVSQQNKHELEQSVSGAPDRPISPSNGKQEFEIIDDIGSEEDGGYEFDSDMDEDEIDALLDAGMQNYRQGSNEEDEFNAPVERDKTVLKEHGHDPFDILPEGWVAVTHNSGMPVYLHKSSRVCTHSRPYFLGPGSARKHDIPLSAIPCLQYRRELDNQQLEASGSTPTATTNGVSTGEEDGSPPATDSKPEKEPPIVRVECLEKYQKEKMLKFMEVREYCERLFEFQIITIKKYRTWKDRRKHHKLLKHNARPSLPSSTKLITCPILLNKQEEKVNRKKEFVLNPVGKSDICILHEYVQHAMRIQPHYIIKELENAQTPYSATVLIHNVEYGVGYASSKKAAKNEAAKMTLGILIPELKESKSNNQDIQDLSFFDEVKIQDPRVHDLCHKAGQPGPFQILCECLRRNFGMGDTNCKMEMKTLKHQKSEFTMLVGKHSATVICKNKREGKQFAAQAILQKLHPHIHSWGSLLRLYGTDWKAIKEKEEELSVTSLHGQAAQCMPNTAILSKLKGEMKKLQLRRGSALDALDLAAEWRVDLRLVINLCCYLTYPWLGWEHAQCCTMKLIEQYHRNANGLAMLPWDCKKFESCLCCALKVVATKSLGMQTDAPHHGTTRAVQTDVVMSELNMDESAKHPIHSVSGAIAFLPRVLQKSTKKTSEESNNDNAISDARLDKILVEMWSQTETLVEFQNFNPQVTVAIREGDKLVAPTPDPSFRSAPLYPQALTGVSPLMTKIPPTPDLSSGLGTVQLYTPTLAGVSPLMSSMSPYVLGSVVYSNTAAMNAPQLTPQLTPQMTPLPIEYRVARKSDDIVASEMATRSSAPAATSTTTENKHRQVEKNSLSSYKSYWRAMPNSYTPQESLVSAGSVPLDQRCWKKQTKVVTAALTVAVRESANQTRTPSPRFMPAHSSTPRTVSQSANGSSPQCRSTQLGNNGRVQPLMEKRNFQNLHPVGKNKNPSPHQQYPGRKTPDHRPSPPAHAPAPWFPPPAHGVLDGPWHTEPVQQNSLTQQNQYPWYQEPAPQAQSPQPQPQPQMPQQAQSHHGQPYQNTVPPPYQAENVTTAAYYQPQYMYGETTAPYGYAYQYAPTWNW